jgi:hypothetical protein
MKVGGQVMKVGGQVKKVGGQVMKVGGQVMKVGAVTAASIGRLAASAVIHQEPHRIYIKNFLLYIFLQ